MSNDNVKKQWIDSADGTIMSQTQDAFKSALSR